MNLLLDPFRHNAWATRQLLAFCRGLSNEQLEATAPGAYGSIRATLHHVVESDGYYRFRLSGDRPSWLPDEDAIADLARIEAWHEEMADWWEAFLAGPVDPERSMTWRSHQGAATRTAKAGVILAQALNHGNEHRGQVCTILTTLGIDPPDLDGWEYGTATGRFVELPG